MKTINAIATIIALGLSLVACASESTTTAQDALDGVGGSDSTDATEVTSTGGSKATVTTVVQFVEVPNVELSKCVPGTQPACACTDGSSGAQVCQDNGTMGDCVCEAPAVVVPANPDGYSGSCIKLGNGHLGGMCATDQPILYANCPGQPDFNGGVGCLDVGVRGDGVWCCAN
jgi:hypothetical protein